MSEPKDNSFKKPEKENIETQEPKIEKPEQVLEVAENVNEEIEREKTVLLEEKKVAQEAMEDLGGNENDIEEVEDQLRPIQEEIKNAVDEAQREIEIASAEVMGEKWSASAKKALEARGYQIDPETPPYKSYNEKLKERFYIQKSIDRQGNAVVVKISSPLEKSKRELKDESLRYDFLERAKKESGKNIGINFPVKQDEFEHEGQNGLVTNFAEDDPKAKDNLSESEKINLVLKVVREMQKLPVPQEEIAKPYGERSLQVMTASEYKWQIQQSKIPNLLENGLISSEMAVKISRVIEDSQKILDTFSLKFEHGDLHGGNIFYSVDKSGAEHITLIDLEALKLTNEFSPLAQIAQREELIGRIREYGKKSNAFKEFGPMLEKVFKLLDNNGKLTAKMEEEFIAGHERPKEAERAYRIMRVYELLNSLQGTAKSKEKHVLAGREIYQEMLKEQMDLLEK